MRKMILLDVENVPPMNSVTHADSSLQNPHRSFVPLATIASIQELPQRVTQAITVPSIPLLRQFVHQATSSQTRSNLSALNVPLDIIALTPELLLLFLRQRPNVPKANTVPRELSHLQTVVLANIGHGKELI